MRNFVSSPFVLISVTLIIIGVNHQAGADKFNAALVGSYYQTLILNLQKYTTSEKNKGAQSPLTLYTDNYMGYDDDYSAWKDLAMSHINHCVDDIDWGKLDNTALTVIQQAIITLCKNVNAKCSSTYTQDKIPLKTTLKDIYVNKAKGNEETFNTESNQVAGQ